MNILKNKKQIRTEMYMPNRRGKNKKNKYGRRCICQTEGKKKTKEYFNSFTKNYNGDMYRNLFNIHFAIIFACHIKNNTRTSSSHLKAEV
jgi:hypothetical protein